MRDFSVQLRLDTPLLLSGADAGAVDQDIGSEPDIESRFGYAGDWGYEQGMLDIEGAVGTAHVTLLHLGERWYQPGIGRFIQRDRSSLRDGPNVYLYVHANPISGTDATGRYHWNHAPGDRIAPNLDGRSVGPAITDAWHWFGTTPLLSWFDDEESVAQVSACLAAFGEAGLLVTGVWGLGAQGLRLLRAYDVVRAPLANGGFSIRIGRNFRFDHHSIPGHTRPLPHYHRRGPGGIGRHRPWEGW